MISAPVFDGLDWLVHGFGLRTSDYPDGICLIRQIHSNFVLDEAALASAPLPEGQVAEGDALISRRHGVIVGVKTADCVPVLLADPVTRTVAAVHAGWRGTAENIAGAAVARMTADWGVAPENLRAAIGPSIGPCCYEVGSEVALRFGMKCTKTIHLDLPFRNEKQLRDAGVQAIWTSGECTFCAAERFYSFRRERDQAGRMISFIGTRRDDEAG